MKLFRSVIAGVCILAPAIAQPPLKFEVASVKPHPPSDREGNIGPFPGGFKATGIPLNVLIQIAYRLKEYQIAGSPSWVNEDHFDIEARFSAGLNPNHEQQQKMLQALLGDRFGLKIHFEKRELPALAITLIKGTSKLTPAGPSDPDTPELTLSNGFVRARGTTMAGLADAIANESDRAVIDRTGLAGKFDVTLKWSPDINDPTGVGLVTAMEEQLGLKLESTKAPVDVLVVDSVQKPSQN